MGVKDSSLPRSRYVLTTPVCYTECEINPQTYLRVFKRWFKRFLLGLILGSFVVTVLSAEAQSAIVVSENEDSIRRGIDASSARYTALAEYYAASALAER